MLIRIVDDEATNLALFKGFVSQVGADLTVACHVDPAEALAACKPQPPDLVLLDYMMPGMDGLAFIERFRQLPLCEDVPIVMITADGDRAVRRKALALGANDFVEKPVDRVEMAARVANHLALRRFVVAERTRNKDLAAEVARATSAVVSRERELIVRLSKAAEFRDPETGGHIMRMAHHSKGIAEAMGIPADLCRLIMDAAPMHDVGKLGIADAILLKPGKLTDDEFEVMRGHPTIGHQILAGSDSDLIRLGAEIALTHHEKYDGSGYPVGLKGDDIPIAGRIVAVADVFDALTSARPYKPAWTAERARDFLVAGKGTHFDPRCVDAFLSDWGRVLAVMEAFMDDPIGEEAAVARAIL